MKISVAIMAHPKRTDAAIELLKKVGGMQFRGPQVYWDERNDEWDTGLRALTHGIKAAADWHIVLQDDAIISETFYLSAVNALQNVPERTLVSFYTGTVRPEPSRVAKAVERAAKNGASWLSGNTLFWGVGIAIPTEQISEVLKHSARLNMKYDRRIGYYYQKHGMPVYYTSPSLVDHDYKLGSIIGNDYQGQDRQAHQYCKGVVRDWNREVVRI